MFRASRWVSSAVPHPQQRDHEVEKCFTGIGGNPDLDVIREHLRATCYGAPIPSGFPNYGGAFSRNRRFIDTGNALNDFPVPRDQIAGFAVHDVSGPQLRSTDRFHPAIRENLPRHCIRLRSPQCVSLSLSPCLRHGLGEIGEGTVTTAIARFEFEGGLNASDCILDHENGRQPRPLRRRTSQDFATNRRLTTNDSLIARLRISDRKSAPDSGEAVRLPV